MGDVISTIVGVLTIGVVLGGAFFVGRSSNLRATISDQRTRIENLDGIVTIRDRELADERATNAALEARVAALEGQAHQLSEIVSGRVDYSALEVVIASHHADVMRALSDLHHALQDVKKLLDARRTGDYSVDDG